MKINSLLTAALFAGTISLSGMTTSDLNAEEINVATDEKSERKKGHKHGKRGNPEERFKKVDTNEDGSISLEEFLNAPHKKRKGGEEPSEEKKAKRTEMMTKFFKNADKDESGGLSLEEMKEMHKEAHGKRKGKGKKKARSEESSDED